MIHVTMIADKNAQMIQLCAEGHADYAPVNEDIVCSAVSIVCFSIEAYFLCQPRERFSMLNVTSGEGHTGITAFVNDREEYAIIEEAIKPARFAFTRLAGEYPDHVLFEDMTR